MNIPEILLIASIIIFVVVSIKIIVRTRSQKAEPTIVTRYEAGYGTSNYMKMMRQSDMKRIQRPFEK